MHNNIMSNFTVQAGTLHAGWALLPDGWTRDVRLTIGEDGRIGSLETGRAAQAEDHRLVDRLLLPAPGNLHSHAFQRAMAGMSEYRRGGDDFWSWRALMYQFLALLDPDQIEAIAAMVQVEMLEAGYAAVGEFHYLHHRPDGGAYDRPAETSAAVAAAAARSGIGLTHLPVFYACGGAGGQPLETHQRRFGCDLERFAGLLADAEDALAPLPADRRLGLAPHSLRAVLPEHLPVLAGLRPSDPVHIHIAEQQREIEEIEAWLGTRPVAWLQQAIAPDARWCLVHATHMDATETRQLAASGAVAGLCPITEANLGDGLFEAPAYLAAGGAFGIGSDSNIRIALSEELRLLEYGQRLRDRGRAIMAPEGRSVGRHLYEQALAGGARALGRESGALAPGLWADLLTLDADDLAFAARAPERWLDAWLFAGDDRAVREVWAAGRPVVRDGRHRARREVERDYRAVLADLADRL